MVLNGSFQLSNIWVVITITDYDLGRAKGKIVIEHDERGFKRAEAANDGLAKSARRVAEGYEDAEKAQADLEKQNKKLAVANDTLAKKQEAVTKNLNRLNEAQAYANRLKEDGKEGTERYKTALESITKAQNRYNESVTEASRVESKRNDVFADTEKSIKSLEKAIMHHNSHNKVQIDTTEVRKKIDKAKTDMRELHKLIRASSSVGGAGLGALGGVAKVGAMGAGGAALGGLAGLGGSAGAGVGVMGLSGIVSAISDMSGALGALPGIIGGIATVVGTVKLGLDGFSDAIGSIGTKDFTEDLKKLAPEAQRVALTISVMKKAFDQLKMNVQNELFQGLSQVLQNIGQTYLPILNQGLTAIAGVANYAAKEFANFLMQPQTQSDVKGFLEDVKNAFKILVDNMQPALQAFRDIMAVSGSLLPELAKGLGDALREFSAFISAARADGSLREWIKSGLDAVKTFIGAIIDIGKAFGNIGHIADQFGGGLINWLAKIGAEFRAWTESAEGKETLSKFFQATTEALKAFMPIMKSVGNTIFGIIIPALAKLGTGIAPGMLTFFDQLGSAFQALANGLNDPTTISALNQILTVVGTTFNSIMQTLGPQLPKLFESFLKIVNDLAPVAESLATALANMLDSLSPDEIATILEVVGALSALFSIAGPVATIITTLSGVAAALGITLGPLIGIIALVVAAIAVFALEVYALHENFDKVIIAIGTFHFGLVNLLRDVMTSLTEFVGNVIAWGAGLLKSFGDAFDKVLEFFGTKGSEWYEAGKKLVGDMMDGMLDQLGPIGTAAKEIAQTINDYLQGHSPTKKGPLSGKGWTRYSGQKVAKAFAEGMQDGQAYVEDSAQGIAKSTSSGMEEFVRNMTELTGFAKRVASLAGDITNQIFETLKLATTNPLTGESFIFKKHWRRSISDADLRRQNEDEAYRKTLDDRASTGVDIADALGVDIGQTKLTTSSSQNDSAKAIIAEAQKRGYDKEQIQAILATSMQESGLDPNIVDPSGQWKGLFQQDKSYAGRDDPNQQITAFLDRLDKLRASGGSSGDIWKDIFWLQQAPGMSSADSAYSGGRQAYLDEIKSKSGAAGDLIDQILGSGSSVPILAGLRPGSGGTYGLPKGIDTGGYGTGNADTFPPWVMEIAKRFGVLPSTYSGHQETDRSNEAGYAPNPNHENRGIDWSGSVENMQAFADWLKANYGAMPGLEQIIWENPNTGQRIGMGGNGNFAPGYYDAGTYSEHRNHVHTRQSSALINSRSLNSLGPYPGATATATGIYAGGTVANIDPNYNLKQLYPGVPVDPLHMGSGMLPGPVDAQDSSNLQAIADNTSQSLTQQDQMINQLRSQDPALDSAIRIAEDANSSDSQVASALDYISGVSDKQRSLDTPEGRYMAQGLDSVTGKAANRRGMQQDATNPLDTAQSVASGIAGLVSDGLSVASDAVAAIGSADKIAQTLVRGVENTEDLYKIVDEIQSFIQLGASIAKTVSDGLAMAATVTGAAAPGDPSGTTAAVAAGLGVASSIAGIVSTVFSTVNAAIDIGQEAYKIITKYVGQFLSEWIGVGAGAMLGDIQFLLDQNTGQLKIWSGDNPQDKRIMDIPKMLQADTTPSGNGIRDLNMFVGPGTDPAEAMNAAMWSIKTDRNGVFTSSAY